ncbi:hypothetical protein ACROYT_G039455 [Oculina patagonica]
MKFVLIFAFLAFANFCLGNTTGPDQKVCANPCKPIDIRVHGKEGEKGQKGEKGNSGLKGNKGNSGTSCKCNLQDPNKPSAHIEAASKKDVTYYANRVIKDWSISAPNSHLAGGMKYHDGKLTVPTPGRYYIYTQLYSRSRDGRVYVKVNNRIITMIQTSTSGSGEGTLYAGGVFYLKAGDVISLTTGFTAKLYMGRVHSYFGAFLI